MSLVAHRQPMRSYMGFSSCRKRSTDPRTSIIGGPSWMSLLTEAVMRIIEVKTTRKPKRRLFRFCWSRLHILSEGDGAKGCDSIVV
ncbi:hypothetical protein Hdeb2414_s0016g00479981 [Helianthus debilis subsp. tardiflorus]